MPRSPSTEAAPRGSFGTGPSQELTKQLGWAEDPPFLLHARADGGMEVDFVLEGRDGLVVGIEVTSAATIRSDDARGLRRLAEWIGPRFHRGVILYTGERRIVISDRITAVPVSALWNR